MDLKTCNDLQWDLLIKDLITYARTESGQKECQNLRLDLDAEEIKYQWGQITPLLDLIKGGYLPPISPLDDMGDIFKAAKLSSVLDGEALRQILDFLYIINQLHAFSRDFKERCSPLQIFNSTVYPLPKLREAIEGAIAPDGEIRDDASPELLRIRKEKVGLRKKIEADIKQLLVNANLENYIQDKYFTIRADRYVIPVKIDGRGRVKGSIYDTSDSGQTLFIEPSAIAPANESLLELELSEKLEILKIFRMLSKKIQDEIDILTDNYDKLVELDVLTAKACLGNKYRGSSVKLAEKPSLNLKEARHPLLITREGKDPVPNEIELEKDQSSLIISGPNAGGKTVLLKTTGMLHLMLKAGLLIPADPDSEMYLYDRIYIAMGDAQSITANLSTFSGHLLTLKPILNQANTKDLVLLDELAVGTDPHTGGAIARSILEFLANKNITTISTTHYDSLKGLALSDHRFRNGSMEFSQLNLKPTYHLNLDRCGQSYGIEVAKDMGLPEEIIQKARDFKGAEACSLDLLVESLSQREDEAKQEKDRFIKERLAMESQKSRWEMEREALKEAKKGYAKKLEGKYDREVSNLKAEVNETLESLKKLLKRARKLTPENMDKFSAELSQQKQRMNKQLSNLDNTISSIEKMSADNKPLPGKPAKKEDLRVGDQVFVTSIMKKGTIKNIQKGQSPVYEIQAGLLKMKVKLSDLRTVNPSPKPTPKKTKDSGIKSSKTQSNEIKFVIPTKGNTLDLRGTTVDSALEENLEFYR